MISHDKQEQFEAQTSKQFEALGKFVQAFEHLVFAIRSGLSWRLQQESPNMVFFTRMLLHHRVLTAWPLWEMFRAVVYTDVSELRPTTPSDADEFHRALTKIGNEVSELLAARNNIVHGTPFIGWVSADQEDFTRMDIYKYDVSAKGWKVADTPKSAADLLVLEARCKGAENAVRRIGLAAALPEAEERRLSLARAVDELEVHKEPTSNIV